MKIKVIANAKINKIEKLAVDQFKVWLTAPAVEGKANVALIKFLAKHFNISKSKIDIVKGLKNKNKIVLLKN